MTEPGEKQRLNNSRDKKTTNKRQDSMEYKNKKTAETGGFGDSEVGEVGDDGGEGVCFKVKICHIRQSSNWDCGLACIKMVLKTYKKNIEKFPEVCAKLNLKTSIWTIDLAYILYFYAIDNSYTTITLGVDESYSNKSFYKDNYDEDSKRVESMFQSAEHFGLSISERSVSMSEIIDHLKTNRPIIILIDWNIVKWTNGLALNCQCFRRLIKKVTSYQGHYVLLSGCNTKKNCIYYHNPEKSDEMYSMHVDVLEQARKSHGTDEDIIFIKEKLP